jgi:hypothetical protein
VNGNGKHSSLLRYGKNYDRTKFCGTSPIKLVNDEEKKRFYNNDKRFNCSRVLNANNLQKERLILAFNKKN